MQKDAPRPGALKPEPFIEAVRVPFELEIPVARDDTFAPLLACQEPLAEFLSEFTIERRKKDLLVHNDGMPRPLKVRGGRKPVVLELPRGEGKVPVLFYLKQDEWFAAPADRIAGKTALGYLELLDVDLDGSFDGELDFLAWRDGRFHLQGAVPRIHSEAGLHTFTINTVKSKILVEVSPPQFPEGISPAATSAWLVTNELRNEIGLEPVQMDVGRTDAAAAHAHYLQTNRDNGVNPLNVHDELPDLPGYTPEGEMAARGNVSWHGGGNNLARQPLHEFATLFHRSEFVYPSLTMGAGGEGQYGVVWVEDAQHDTERWLKETGMESSWVMVPAPGQTGVPQRALRDSPVPASVPNFYSRDRGYPVSVSSSYTYAELEEVSLRLFDSEGEELKGFPITMADAGFTSQGFSADYLFAAEQSLKSKSEYRAEFRAKLKASGRLLSFSWSFSTGK